MNNSEGFFLELLKKTAEKFSDSEIKKLQDKQGREWNYAICDTPIQQGHGIIFGINWGGNGNYKAQTQIPDGKEICTYPFIARTRKYLEPDWGVDFNNFNFNYSNLCFFRSPKASDLVLTDFELSRPLFKDYVKHINPPWLLSLGGSTIEVLKKLKCFDQAPEEIFDSEGKFKGYSAKLWGFNLYSVPHPSARLKTEARDTIWKKVTDKKNLNSQ